MHPSHGAPSSRIWRWRENAQPDIVEGNELPRKLARFFFLPGNHPPRWVACSRAQGESKNEARENQHETSGNNASLANYWKGASRRAASKHDVWSSVSWVVSSVDFWGCIKGRGCWPSNPLSPSLSKRTVGRGKRASGQTWCSNLRIGASSVALLRPRRHCPRTLYSVAKWKGASVFLAALKFFQEVFSSGSCKPALLPPFAVLDTHRSGVVVRVILDPDRMQWFNRRPFPHCPRHSPYACVDYLFLDHVLSASRAAASGCSPLSVFALPLESHTETRQQINFSRFQFFSVPFFFW